MTHSIRAIQAAVALRPWVDRYKQRSGHAPSEAVVLDYIGKTWPDLSPREAAYVFDNRERVASPSSYLNSARTDTYTGRWK